MKPSNSNGQNRPSGPAFAPCRRSVRRREDTKPHVLILAMVLSATLAACGGGGAGDGTDTGTPMNTPNPVETVVGTWDISGNWQGTPADEALLVIRPVDNTGRARAVIHDFSETDNCYDPAFGGGTAQPDGLQGTQIFLNNTPPFHDAILTLDGDILVITYFDRDDTDGNGDRSERRDFRAPNVALAEIDIGPGC